MNYTYFKFFLQKVLSQDWLALWRKNISVVVIDSEQKDLMKYMIVPGRIAVYPPELDVLNVSWFLK